MKPRTVFGALLVLGALITGGIGSSSGAVAKDRAEFLPAFLEQYPAASGTAVGTCFVCHFLAEEDDGEVEYEKNRYARDWKEAGMSFVAVEGIDSDGDGYGNLAEINAGTMPGDAPSNPGVTTTTLPGPPPDPGSGAALYAANCASCHGAGGEFFGPLAGTSLSEQQIIDITAGGSGSMPAFSGSLSAGEIASIAQHILALGSTPPPAATTTTTTTTQPGSVPPSVDGAAVFAARCALCHGPSGGDLVGTSLSVAQLVAVTANGAGGMPALGGSMTAAEIEAVANYIAVLGSATTTTTTQPGSVPPSVDGAAVFAARCALCHGPSGGDLVGTSLSVAQLVAVTANGAGGMPALGGSMTAAEIEAVANYIAVLGSGTTPTTTTAPSIPGGLISGAAHYQQMCAACHGPHGEGGPGGPVAGSGLDRTGMIGVITDGVRSMPGYGSRLTSDEVSAVVDFLLALGTNPEAGPATEAGVDASEAASDDGTDDDRVGIESSDDDKPMIAADSAAGVSLFGPAGGAPAPATTGAVLATVLAILGAVLVLAGLASLWLRTGRSLLRG